MAFQCGAPAANQNARHPAKARYSAGKGTLRSPVGGTIYANVIWPGMKWKYAARPSKTRPPQPNYRPGPAWLRSTAN